MMAYKNRLFDARDSLEETALEKGSPITEDYQIKNNYGYFLNMHKKFSKDYVMFVK